MCDVEGASASGTFSVWYKGRCTFTNNVQPGCRHLTVQSWKKLQNKISERLG